MRVVICIVSILVVVCVNADSNNRRKRFLPPDALAGLPESLLRLSDHAREFTSKTLDGLFDGKSSVIRRRYNPLQSIFDELTNPQSNNRSQEKNLERETEDAEEDDVKEVIVEEPHKETEEQVPSLFPGIPLSFPFGILTPWWKGPNVCVERNEIDEQSTEDKSGPFAFNFEATQCIPSETSYMCTKKIRNSNVHKTITVKYQCCHGFLRRKDARPGCSKVNMDYIITTLRNLEATKFADLLEIAGQAEKLKTENVTIFAPANEAIVDFEEDTEDNEITDGIPPKKRTRDLTHFTGGHIVEGFVNLATIDNDHVLNALNGRTTIRINKYRPSTGSVITANCVPINSKDNFATNGLVHLTSDVLPMPRKHVFDVIRSAPQFSVFSKLLSQSTLMEELMDLRKSWTLFVPTDSAFEAMDNDMLQRLLAGEGCVDSVLRQHVLQGTVCSHAISGRIYIQNYVGKSLTLSKDDISKFQVNGIKVNTENVVATNGVVHFIDEVLIPDEAHSLMEMLRKNQRNDLLDLIKTAGLESTFDNLNNVTFFAPSRDALKYFSNETMENWQENPNELREILLYHVAAPKTMASDFKNNKEIATLAENQNVRLQLHELFPGIAIAATAQCSLLVKHDETVCGAVLHYVDKVFKPPKSSIMEALKSMEGHDILRKLLENTDLVSKLDSAEEGPYTLLAPTDEAFKRFSKETLDELMENRTQAEQILKMHVLPEPMCCSGVHHSFPFRHHYVRTLEGNLLSLHRSGRQDRVRFGPARAIKCDVMAKNGIVHSVNRVIIPNRRPTPSLFDLDIFKIF